MSTNTTKRVRTNQSRENLYKVSYFNSKFHVYHVSPGFLSDTLRDIGTSKNLEDALTLIRSYSGSEIKSIDNW